MKSNSLYATDAINEMFADLARGGTKRGIHPEAPKGLGGGIAFRNRVQDLGRRNLPAGSGS